jgi:DNA replication protein DnaC
MAVMLAQLREVALQVFRGETDIARTRYTTAVELFVTIKETYGDNAQRSERAAIDLFVKPDLLVIDEVQERAGTEWEQRLLSAIVDRRYAGMKDTILVGNLKPDDVRAELGTSIASRAQETGGIYVADWPSFRTRKAGGAA